MVPFVGTMFLSTLALLPYVAVAAVAPKPLLRTEKVSSKPDRIMSGEDMHPAGPPQKEDPAAASQKPATSTSGEDMHPAGPPPKEEPAAASQGLAKLTSESKAATASKEPVPPAVAPQEDVSQQKLEDASQQDAFQVPRYIKWIHATKEVECSTASFDFFTRVIPPLHDRFVANAHELQAFKSQVFAQILELEKDAANSQKLKDLKHRDFPPMLEKQRAKSHAKVAFANIKVNLDRCKALGQVDPTVIHSMNEAYNSWNKADTELSTRAYELNESPRWGMKECAFWLKGHLAKKKQAVEQHGTDSED